MYSSIRADIVLVVDVMAAALIIFLIFFCIIFFEVVGYGRAIRGVIEFWGLFELLGESGGGINGGFAGYEGGK